MTKETLRVRVIETGSGDPIPEAKVVLTTKKGAIPVARGITNADGYAFMLSVPSETAFRAEVEAAGWAKANLDVADVPATDGSAYHGAELELAPDPITDPDAVPMCTVYGNLFGADGLGLAGEQVLATFLPTPHLAPVTPGSGVTTRQAVVTRGVLSTYTTETGRWSFTVPRGALMRFSCRTVGLQFTTQIPQDKAMARLEDLRPYLMPDQAGMAGDVSGAAGVVDY